MKWLAGSDQVFAQLGSDGAFVDNDYADKHLLELGSPLTLLVAEREDGRRSRSRGSSTRRPAARRSAG